MPLLVYEALRQRDNGWDGAGACALGPREARYFVDAEFMVDDLEALRQAAAASPARWRTRARSWT